MPRPAGVPFHRFGPDATGPGLIDSAPFPDLNAVLAAELDFDGDPGLAEVGVRALAPLVDVFVAGRRHSIFTSGFDADGRQIYRIEGFLNEEVTARAQGALALRTWKGGVNLIVRAPTIDDDDFAGLQSLFEIEDQDELDPEIVPVRDWYVTHLVIVGVRVL